VPVGVVNPTKGMMAGKLQGLPTDGVGNHWWCQLGPADFTAHQLPPVVSGRVRRPPGW